MSVDQMRDALIITYQSVKWRDRVNRMSDGQVVAIFRRLQNNGKIKL